MLKTHANQRVLDRVQALVCKITKGRGKNRQIKDGQVHHFKFLRSMIDPVGAIGGCPVRYRVNDASGESSHPV
jgi:hypothetical protein